MKKTILVLLAALIILLVVSVTVPAQAAATNPEGSGAGEPAVESTENQEAAQPPAARSPLAVGLIAIGASIAVGVTALGTAIAQSRIGAAGAGTIAERPETAGTIILLIAIPETMVILGFVIAIVMIFTL